MGAILDILLVGHLMHTRWSLPPPTVLRNTVSHAFHPSLLSSSHSSLSGIGRCPSHIVRLFKRPLLLTPSPLMPALALPFLRILCEASSLFCLPPPLWISLPLSVLVMSSEACWARVLFIQQYLCSFFSNTLLFAFCHGLSMVCRRLPLDISCPVLLCAFSTRQFALPPLIPYRGVSIYGSPSEQCDNLVYGLVTFSGYLGALLFFPFEWLPVLSLLFLSTHFFLSMLLRLRYFPLSLLLTHQIYIKRHATCCCVNSAVALCLFETRAFATARRPAPGLLPTSSVTPWDMSVSILRHISCVSLALFYLRLFTFLTSDHSQHYYTFQLDSDSSLFNTTRRYEGACRFPSSVTTISGINQVAKCSCSRLSGTVSPSLSLSLHTQPYANTIYLRALSPLVLVVAIP